MLLGENRVLMHYFLGPDDDASVRRVYGKAVIHELREPTAPSELVCFDLQGRELWGRSRLRVLVSLPSDRFLVADSRGIPRILDGDGCELARWTGKGGIDRAVRHDNLLALQAGSTVYVTDLDLQPVNKLEWPRESTPAIDCFVDGSFRWVDGNKLWMRSVFGEPQRFASVPRGIREAVSRRRLPSYLDWQIAFDEDEGVFFLASRMAPHLLICLDRRGNANWCRYIFNSCCGGVGYRLPSGLCVTSSGCGGILTWLDLHGHILFQSEPPPSQNLAFGYSNVVTVLSDGRSLIWGLQGLAAYDSRGELLWKAKLHYGFGQYDVCEDRGLLVGCGWSKHESEGRTTAVLEAVGDL